MLGDAGMGNTHGDLKTVDIDLATAQFLDDPDAVGVGENTEEVCQLFTDCGPCWHVN